MKESDVVNVEIRVDRHRKNRRRPTISRRMCAQSEQRGVYGGGRPPRRGGARMKRSFPPHFYRERGDIPTLSAPSKKGAFMHDRARNERRRAYGSRENGVETSSRPVGGSIEGWLGVTSRYLPLAQIQRMHAYTGKTSNQRPSFTRSGYEITHLCVSKAGVLKKGV